MISMFKSLESRVSDEESFEKFSLSYKFKQTKNAL